jgi:hypothetical protein
VAGLLSLLRRRNDSRIDATIVDITLPENGHLEIWKLSGFGSDVLATIERLSRDQDEHR